MDGQVLVVDPSGRHWVKFVVKQVELSPERPHGLSYSLTRTVSSWLVSTTPTRYSIPRNQEDALFRTIRPYEYRDAATLLADFWAEVDMVLKERGVIP